jgi:DNA-binding beta-propeller fold protein YncE
MSPDGRFGYTPERDSDTVTKFDIAKREVVKTVSFPAGSKPYMLRVSRDGKEVWVQSPATNSNYVLDAEDLKTLATEPCGKGPVTNAWSPDGKYAIVTNSSDTFAQVFDARPPYKEVKRLNVGQGGANIGFTGDGKLAFISVSGANAVAVVDMAKLEMVDQIRAGSQPTGLIVR